MVGGKTRTPLLGLYLAIVIIGGVLLGLRSAWCISRRHSSRYDCPRCQAALSDWGANWIRGRESFDLYPVDAAARHKGANAAFQVAQSDCEVSTTPPRDHFTASGASPPCPRSILVCSVTYVLAYNALPDALQVNLAGVLGLVVFIATITVIFRYLSVKSVLLCVGLGLVLLSAAIDFAFEKERLATLFQYFADTLRLITVLAAMTFSSVKQDIKSIYFILSCTAVAAVAVVTPFSAQSHVRRHRPSRVVYRGLGWRALERLCVDLGAPLRRHFVAPSDHSPMARPRPPNPLGGAHSLQSGAHDLGHDDCLLRHRLSGATAQQLEALDACLGIILILLLGVTVYQMIRGRLFAAQHFSSGRTTAYGQRFGTPGRAPFELIFGTGADRELVFTQVWWWHEGLDSHNSFHPLHVRDGTCRTHWRAPRCWRRRPFPQTSPRLPSSCRSLPPRSSATVRSNAPHLASSSPRYSSWAKTALPASKRRNIVEIGETRRCPFTPVSSAPFQTCWPTDAAWPVSVHKEPIREIDYFSECQCTHADRCGRDFELFEMALAALGGHEPVRAGTQAVRPRPDQPLAAVMVQPEKSAGNRGCGEASCGSSLIWLVSRSSSRRTRPLEPSAAPRSFCADIGASLRSSGPT